MKLLIPVLLTVFFAIVFHTRTAQAGELRGKVVSAERGEPVVGATVVLVGTRLGAKSDLKGTYTVRKVPAGTYTVRISSVGYAIKEISGVVIGEDVQVLDVIMRDSTILGKEVLVRADPLVGTEAALLNIRRKAATVNDGISYAQIRRSPDATSGDALQRVTGLSIIGNKFISVRGTNERYNNTQLNGVALTSTEPDKKSFSFDLFPANLLENTIVSKTFTPDLPGDFTGGLVQLNTVDFPDVRTLRLSVSGSFDGTTTFQPIRLGGHSSTDWLGFDDNVRALPADFPSTDVFKDSLTAEQQTELARQLPNTWTPYTMDAPLNSSFLLSYGDRFAILDNDFGLLAAISYRNSYNSEAILRRDSSVFSYPGVENKFSVLWGGLVNLSYKIADLHTISIKNIYSRTAEDQYTELEGFDYYNDSQLRRLTGASFLERSFYSGQINGEHLFPVLHDLRVQWRGYGTIGEREEPDFRRSTYFRPDTSEPWRALIFDAAGWKNFGRTYNNLDEEMFGFGTDMTMPFGETKVKIGGVVENKTRTFAQRAFAYGSRNPGWKVTPVELDTLLLPDHIGEKDIFLVEQTVPAMKYDAHSNLNAVYLMADLPFQIGSENFRAILGARVEDSRMLVNSASNADASVVNADYHETDILPSINLIYQISDAFNIRTAFSRTVTRPEFREYAPFSFYDFATGQDIYGNPDLRRALSNNYDFRIEYFPGVAEVAAISVFHKNIENAIEQVAISGVSFTNPQLTWSNADEALNTGIEVELRKTLGFISEALSGFAFSVNYTWLDSKSTVKGDSLRSAKEGRLQGQSPYVINAGLYFDDIELGTSVTLLFNRFGARILEVSNKVPGSNLPNVRPDFVEQPRNQLDFSVAQTFFENYEAKFSISNLLGEDQVFTQGDVPSRVNYRDASVSLGVSVKF